MIELRGVTKSYGDVEALRGIDLEIERGELLTLMGPNGSGKTTILRILAALEEQSGGEYYFDGTLVDRGGGASVRRRATMVFQRTVLLRGTVGENAAYGLNIEGLEQGEVARRLEDALDLVGLDGLLERRARSLSGGEQKRLSLARALVLGRELLLLDEPLVNLDPASSQIIREALLWLNRETGTTVVVATHSLEDAEAFSGRVVLLSEGRLVEEGRASDLIGEPSDEMSKFARSENVFSGVASSVEGVTHVDIGGVVVKTAEVHRGRTTVQVRAEDIIISRAPFESSARNVLLGRIIGVEERGSVVRLRVDAGRIFTVQITRRSLDEMGLNVGQGVYLTFKASSVRVL